MTVRLATSVAALSVLALAVAAARADEPQDFALKDTSRITVGRGQAQIVTVLRDRETGCEYLGWEAAYTQGGSITPRLKPDGRQLCRANP